jgi:ribonuclease P protein component
MLAKKYRLVKERDFKRVNSKGLSFFSTLFRLRLLKNSELFNRFAVVVTTRLSKKATKRNRLRRQLTEIIRLHQAELKTGYDAVLMVKTDALKKDYEELEQDFLYLVKKAKLVK